MSGQKLGSLYYTVGIQGMQTFAKDANALRKTIVDLASMPVKDLLAAVNVPDVVQAQRTLNANRTNTINALRTALGSGTLSRPETQIANRALSFIKADSAATIGLFQSLQQQRRAFGEKMGASAEELRSVQTMIKSGEASGEISKGSAFANNLRSAAAHATVVKHSMDGVNSAISRGDRLLAASYEKYEASNKTAADRNSLAAATAKHVVNESLAVERMEHKEKKRLDAAKRRSAEYGEFEFAKMVDAQAADTAARALADARRRTRQYVVKSGNTFIETKPAVIRARQQNATDAEAADRVNRLDALLSGSRTRLAGAERAYESGPKTRPAQDQLNEEALRYGVDEQRARERVASERRLERHAIESAIPRSHDENRIINQEQDLNETLLHVSEQRADIERRVDGILGTQVSHLDKIRASEEAALKYARQRAGRDLTAQETSDVSRDVRERERRQLVGGDAANTSSRLQEVQESIYSIQSSGSTSTPDVQHQMERRVRMLKEEAVLLVRRQELLERQAMLENALASGALSRGQKFLTQNELNAVNEELKKNASATVNSQRHQAGDDSRKYNYRLQELSYGVQDFTQVLAGGGGLDGALRAANNNISQFYAAAGGANAARNSMVATFAILGIAAALKYMGDMAELPAKRLEEVNERLKTTQSLSKDLGRLFEVGSTRVGDISGEPAITGARAQSESERDARLQRQQINNEAEIFGIKQKPSFGEGVGRNVRIDTGAALAAIGGIASLGGLVQNSISDYFNRGARELRDTGSKSDLGKVFKERFVDRKSSSEIENSREVLDPILITPRTRKYFDAILKSADTSPAAAVKAFKEIDEGGGWSDVSDEEMKPFRDSIQKIEEQLKRIRVAAVVFENALASMSKNITSRNQLLSGASLQRRMASNSEDVSFINEQNELASQLEANARANREEGFVAEAEKAEKDAAARRKLARVRLEGMNPGGELLTTQALSFEERLAGFDKQIAEAKRMRDESGFGAGWIRGNQQMRDIRLAKENFLMEDPKSFSFEAQRSNESFAEADERMTKTYQQMTDSINRNSQKSAAAADAARDKLGQAKVRQDSLNAASRTHDSADRMARAYGTRFDEQDAAVDLDHAKRVEKIKQDYSDKGSAARLQQELAAEKAAYDRRRSELQKERSDYYKFSEESRFAEAYGTSYDERQAAFERENASREDEINRNYAKPGQQAERQRQLDIERDRQVRRKSDMDRLEKRDRDDLRNMFAGDAASLIGGREGQHYANAKQLEDRLRQIEDADKAGMFKEDPMEKQRLLDQAETVFNERQKDINRKQVGFSDIGGMWKQIQMSLKPDKSIALATTANAHLSSISKHSSDAGLKVVIALSP